MKRIALFLALSALAGASLVRLPEAGEAVAAPIDVDHELQAVFAPQPTSAEDPQQATTGAGAGGVHTGTGGSALNLADVLTVERRASLWWDYARDIASVTSRLTRKGETTLLVPIDRAVMALPRKPHQNADGTPASDKQFAANIEAFISAHIVPGPLESGKQTETLNKNVQVTLEGEGDDVVIQPGNLRVLGATDASNGRVYYIDGVVPY